MSKRLILGIVILLMWSVLSADQSAVIRILEARITALEKKVEWLESLLTGQMSNNVIDSNKWKDRINWRKLKLGMTMDQVRSFLGEPSKVDGGAVLTYWYYSTNQLQSYVIFEGDSRVFGWREPD